MTEWLPGMKRDVCVRSQVERRGMSTTGGVTGTKGVISSVRGDSAMAGGMGDTLAGSDPDGG